MWPQQPQSRPALKHPTAWGGLQRDWMCVRDSAALRVMVVHRVRISWALGLVGTAGATPRATIVDPEDPEPLLAVVDVDRLESRDSVALSPLAAEVAEYPLGRRGGAWAFPAFPPGSEAYSSRERLRTPRGPGWSASDSSSSERALRSRDIISRWPGVWTWLSPSSSLCSDRLGIALPPAWASRRDREARLRVEECSFLRRLWRHAVGLL